MPDFPVGSDQSRVETWGTSGSIGTTVTAGGTNNTKGSYAQLTASSSFDSNMLLVQFQNASNGSSGADYLVDIAVGAGGSETVLVSNLPFPHASVSGLFRAYIPLRIPAGTRVSARSQCTAFGSTFSASIVSFGGSFVDGSACTSTTTYGDATGDSGGTSIDPGGSANTKGSYTQITAATTRPHNWLLVCPQNQAQATRGDDHWLIDVAVGAGGSEQVLIPDLVVTSGSNRVVLPSVFSLPVSIPTGTRLSAKASCNDTVAGTRVLDIILIGCS